MNIPIRSGAHSQQAIDAIVRAAQAFEVYNRIDFAAKNVMLGGVKIEQVRTIHERIDAAMAHA